MLNSRIWLISSQPEVSKDLAATDFDQAPRYATMWHNQINARKLFEECKPMIISCNSITARFQIIIQQDSSKVKLGSSLSFNLSLINPSEILVEIFSAAQEPAYRPPIAANRPAANSRVALRSVWSCFEIYQLLSVVSSFLTVGSLWP